MDVTALLKRIESRADYGGQLQHVRVLPERAGRFATPERPLPEPLIRLLGASGIEQLYCHQVAALELARSGQDFVVVTGTASGKTLCYNLPILESAVSRRRPRALFVSRPKRSRRTSSKACWNWSRATPSSPRRASRRVRRRHAHGATPPHSRRSESCAFESGHAACGRAAVSSEMGGVFCRAAVCRCRRSAHVPRNSGGTCVGRAAPADAGVRALRFATRVSWRPARRLPIRAS